MKETDFLDKYCDTFTPRSSLKYLDFQLDISKLLCIGNFL